MTAVIPKPREPRAKGVLAYLGAYACMGAFVVCFGCFSIAPFVFLQEYLGNCDGRVSGVSQTRGGYRLDFRNGGKYFWVLDRGNVRISPGDMVRKERASFRYLVNGVAVISGDVVMRFLFGLPPSLMYPMLVCAVVPLFWYYRAHGELLLSVVTGRDYGRVLPLTCLAIGFLMFLAYTAAFVGVMLFWT